MLNIMPIGEAVADMSILQFFKKTAASTILDLLYACLYHPHRVFAGLCHCANVVGIRCSSFDTMQV